MAAARPRRRARVCYALLAIVGGTVLCLLPAEKIKAQVGKIHKRKRAVCPCPDRLGECHYRVA